MEKSYPGKKAGHPPSRVTSNNRYKRKTLTPSGFSVAFESTGRSGSAGGRTPARTLSAGGTNF